MGTVARNGPDVRVPPAKDLFPMVADALAYMEAAGYRGAGADRG